MTIGLGNWAMVKCATLGCTSEEWLMHWPCQGSEDEIRNGQHFCRDCRAKAWEAECEADPVRTYPVKRIGNVQVKKGNRTFTKAAVVVDFITEAKIPGKPGIYENITEEEL